MVFSEDIILQPKQQRFRAEIHLYEWDIWPWIYQYARIYRTISGTKIVQGQQINTQQ